jgi:hypothetical protein
MGLSLRGRLSALVQRRLQVERRGSKRVAPAQRMVCLLSKPGESEQTGSVVQNLSIKGIGLQSERGYEPGEVLHALLVNAAHTFSVSVELRVSRCSHLTEKRYFVAGPFTRPLTHDEIVPFIL